MSNQRASVPGSRVLNAIERVGNLLPEPVFIFLGCAAIVVVLSAIGAALGWKVTVVKPALATRVVVDATGAAVLDDAGQPVTEVEQGSDGRARVTLVETGQELACKSLLDREGSYWALANMVKNFVNFAPLGLILTCMLGIGVTERVGLFDVLLKWLGSLVPLALLTPTVIFLGTLSHIASDSGYLILPPLAAALYAAVGRSPLAGVAAAFAGLAGGFSANVLISTIDAVMAGLTMEAARILEPDYQVNPLCNWGFFAASALFLTLVAWGLTAWYVEPRLKRLPPELGGPPRGAAASADARAISPGERSAALWAIATAVAAIAVAAALIFVPGAPLHGPIDPTKPEGQDRWTQAVVPLIFFAFLVPGLVFGVRVGKIRGQKDVAACLTYAMATMAPVITLYFFAAQFVEYMNYSNLGRMLAFTGGRALVEANLSPLLLLVGVVALSLTADLVIGSMSAKWTMLAPILVPMFMMVGISPELTQAAYRVGDSVVNIITPLNPYMILILAAMQKYAKGAGMGSLIALMAPYSFVFAILWTLFLLAWTWLGIPLGPAGPLEYVPAG
jgi:aminobenzoyl-glutamate transport protein